MAAIKSKCEKSKCIHCGEDVERWSETMPWTEAKIIDDNLPAGNICLGAGNYGGSHKVVQTDKNESSVSPEGIDYIDGTVALEGTEDGPRVPNMESEGADIHESFEVSERIAQSVSTVRGEGTDIIDSIEQGEGTERYESTTETEGIELAESTDILEGTAKRECNDAHEGVEISESTGYPERTVHRQCTVIREGTKSNASAGVPEGTYSTVSTEFAEGIERTREFGEVRMNRKKYKVYNERKSV